MLSLHRIGKKSVAGWVAFVLVGLAAPASAQGGIWTRKADMPTPRYFFSASAVDGKIYAIGGYKGGEATVEMYDPAADTWTRKADMPTPRGGLSTCAVDGRIYAIGGGVSTYENPLPTVEMYDPAADTWTRKVDMPTRRWSLSANAVGGRIYAIGGGLPTGEALAMMEEYDPATDTWTRKPNLPARRGDFAAGVAGGRIYAVGGCTDCGQIPLGSLYADEYDPTAGTWSQKAAIPLPRLGLGASAAEGRIYTFGGWTLATFGGWTPTNLAIVSIVEEYDPATDTWTRLPDMPLALTEPATSEIDGRIYVIGGRRTDGGATAAVYEYQPGQVHLLRTATPRRTVWAGRVAPLPIEVQLKGPSADGSFPPLYLDLSSLGGPTQVPLQHQGEGRYVADPLVTPPEPGVFYLPVQLAPSGSSPALLYGVQVLVLAEERMLFADGLEDNWGFAPQRTAAVDPASRNQIHTGQTSLEVRTDGIWTLQCTLAEPVRLTGYGTLRLFLHPGSATGAVMEVRVNAGSYKGILSKSADVAHADLSKPTWQAVEIPLNQLGVGPDEDEAITSVTFNGLLKGTFYLDDIGLGPPRLPQVDQPVFSEGVAEGWSLTASKLFARTDPASASVVYQGGKALSVQTSGPWRVSLESRVPLYCLGYESLHFAVHPGTATGKDLAVWVDDRSVNLIGGNAAKSHVDLADKTWQVVEIPLVPLGFQPQRSIASIAFSGDVQGTLYLDDIRLVAAPPAPPTAVLEDYATALPSSFTLSQNYPNPFNSETTIRFSLPAAGEVELVLYNLAGQRVATLAQGRREAGSYVLRWDGRDERGQGLASGVYLYRLQAGVQVEVRKLLLLR